MEHSKTILCPKCNSEDLYKNGHRPNGTQRWRCKSCNHFFQLDFIYRARIPGIKEQIYELTLNSNGVRDTARILGINKNTVVNTLKKTLNVNPYLLEQVSNENKKGLDVTIRYTAEIDEFWSFVGKKANQRWTWYAIENGEGKILAWHNGKRTDKDFLILYGYLNGIPIDTFHTDNWGSYSKYLPKEKHVIGKADTWRIERKNLNFRTHIKRLNRRTICFSKNEQVHDNVIGMYIEKYYYKYGKYGDYQPF